MAAARAQRPGGGAARGPGSGVGGRRGQDGGFTSVAAWWRSHAGTWRQGQVVAAWRRFRVAAAWCGAAQGPGGGCAMAAAWWGAAVAGGRQCRRGGQGIDGGGRDVEAGTRLPGAGAAEERGKKGVLALIPRRNTPHTTNRWGDLHYIARRLGLH
jgi:hypothetical protein